jgi:hypothetical protein
VLEGSSAQFQALADLGLLGPHQADVAMKRLGVSAHLLNKADSVNASIKAALAQDRAAFERVASIEKLFKGWGNNTHAGHAGFLVGPGTVVEIQTMVRYDLAAILRAGVNGGGLQHQLNPPQTTSQLDTLSATTFVTSTVSQP